MYLAINYSPAAANLVQSGDITIDYFKTPDWDWIVNKASLLKPVAVHFGLEAGNGSLDQVDWDLIRHLRELTNTPYVNIHVDARQCYYPDFPVNTAKKDAVEIVTKVILSDVMALVNRFGADRVIIENSPYQGFEGNTMRLCIMPDLLRRVVEETGCGFLLDISHAVIAANTLGLNPNEYIVNLPVRMLKELHFAGIHLDKASGQLSDHLSILEENWQWLDWVLAQTRSGDWGIPWLLAFEYGGVGEPFTWRSNPQVIAEQVPILYEHLKQLC
jgi:uncharacterized protein (UPF0276 family)